jgi:hypothetical protein
LALPPEVDVPLPLRFGFIEPPAVGDVALRNLPPDLQSWNPDRSALPFVHTRSYLLASE